MGARTRSHLYCCAPLRAATSRWRGRRRDRLHDLVWPRARSDAPFALPAAAARSWERPHSASRAREPCYGGVGKPVSNLHRAAATITDLACRMLGRRDVVRAARFVLRRARLDVPNDLRHNGESSLQRWILELSAANRQIHVIDVGANVGRWSSAMLSTAQQAGRLNDIQLHAFEPSSYTFRLLSEALDGYPVRLHRAALCEQPGTAALYVIAPGAGTNSLHAPPGSEIGGSTENVV